MMWDKITKAAAGAMGAMLGLVGGWDALLSVLVTLMAADYLTGIITAAMQKSPKTPTGALDSRAGFAGICRKLLMLLGVLTAAQLDRVLPGGSAMCRDAVICFLIANEGISIAENAALCGVPFPKSFLDMLEKLKENKQDK
ncbi:MAG: phage holin family protein [Clostridia bacterium]|nr:phage holin family protein [Clostridia bacterium]